MSPQLLALMGVIVGALLAGAGNLLLAWRDETIRARAGVFLILKVLMDALEEIKSLRERSRPRWSPEPLPDRKTWDEYRAAVSGRLALARLRKIDIAMRHLDRINGAAARAASERAERARLLIDAATRNDPVAVGEIKAVPDPELLDEQDIAFLNLAEKDLETARDALVEVTPTGLKGRTRNPRALKPWLIWHARSLAASLVLILLLATVLGLSTGSGHSDAAEVQETLSQHFGDPAFTSCEPVQDQEADFSCVVVKQAEPTPCEAGATTSRSRSGSLFAREENETPSNASCGLITQALSYNAKKRAEANCVAFFQAGISNVPTDTSPGDPAFDQRIKAMLRRQTHTAEGIPPVIVPDSDFTDDC